MAVLAMIMIVARGHERRLRGAYSSQNTGLAQNKTKVIADYIHCAPAAGGRATREDSGCAPTSAAPLRRGPLIAHRETSVPRRREVSEALICREAGLGPLPPQAL